MNRRQFITTTSAAAAAAALLPTRAWTAAPERRLLIVFAPGGWDPLYVFDRKATGAPDVVPAAKRFFEQHGAVSCVVNGLHVRSIGH